MASSLANSFALFEQLRAIYCAVFRSSTDSPGFYFYDFGSGLDSSTLRRRLVELKDGLARLCRSESDQALGYQWIGRFDHQHTSMFHRDNAGPRSFLMLGYEPSEIDSRVWVADYSKYVDQQGITMADYSGG